MDSNKANRGHNMGEVLYCISKHWQRKCTSRGTSHGGVMFSKQKDVKTNANVKTKHPENGHSAADFCTRIDFSRFITLVLFAPSKCLKT
jgi:hypothetical protein